MLDALASFHFIRPWWLLGVPVVVGVYLLWRRRSDHLQGWRAQMDQELLSALTVGSGDARRGSDRWWLVGWVLALVSVAGPAWRLKPSPFAEDAAPLVILLKTSDSMNRTVHPPSAMERATLKIADLADVRKGEPLGLIAYAGSSHLVLPPTRDTKVVAQMAAELSPDVMPVAGDRLDLAIQRADDLLAEEETGGTLLVIADSVEMEAQALSQLQENAVKYPVQFLALTDKDSPEAESLVDAAGPLRATVQYLTADDTDVTNLVNAAARSLAGVSGKSTRWQDAGYWMVPLIAVLVALSFRREAPARREEAP